MSRQTMEIDDVEAEAARRITEIDATAYQQGDATAEFSEIQSFNTRGENASSLAHLGFNAVVEDSPNTGDERDGPHTYARVRSRLVIMFSYRLQPGAQIASARLARKAAHDVIRALNAPSSEWNATLVNAGRPLLSGDRSLMIFQIFFDILHEFEV